MPDCEYFEEGSCSKDECAYRHIKHSSDAKRCDDFLNGFCPMGRSCEKRHLLKSASESNVKKKEKRKMGEEVIKDVQEGRIAGGVGKKARTTSVIARTNQKHLDIGSSGPNPSSIPIRSCDLHGVIPTDMTETDLFIPFPDFGDLMGLDSEVVRRGRDEGGGESDSEVGVGAEGSRDGDIDDDGDQMAWGEDLDPGIQTGTESDCDFDSVDTDADRVPDVAEDGLREGESGVACSVRNTQTAVALSSAVRRSEEGEEHLQGRGQSSSGASSSSGRDSGRDSGSMDEENCRIIAELKAAKIFNLLPTSFLKRPDLLGY